MPNITNTPTLTPTYFPDDLDVPNMNYNPILTPVEIILIATFGGLLIIGLICFLLYKYCYLKNKLSNRPILNNSVDSDNSDDLYITML